MPTKAMELPSRTVVLHPFRGYTRPATDPGGRPLEIPIAIVFLSRTLKPVANRWANTVAAVVTAAFVVAGGSAYLHAVFFVAVEVGCLALIVWSVWARPHQEGSTLRS